MTKIVSAGLAGGVTARPAIVASGALIAILGSGCAHAVCLVDLSGTWQQTHTVIQGNKLRDDSQAWTFKPKGAMQFTKTKPRLSIAGSYTCQGNMIFITGRMNNQFKITEHGLDDMTWESERGATIYVKRPTK
ncbi:MAG: hypothetical protein ABI612_17120 [Betaproteobacteria bacterium]